jgi:hypothetical protein
MRFATCLAVCAVLASFQTAQPRVVRLTVDRVKSPAFGGRSFGNIIADISHAPNNTKGRVEYSADVMILRPVRPLPWQVRYE